MNQLKWTIRGKLEIVYTGTKKEMTLHTGWADLADYGCGECINGVKVGRWEYFDTPGVPTHIAHYDDGGLEHGIQQSFHGNGQLQQVEHYEHGRPCADSLIYREDGSLREQHRYTPEGRTLESRSWHPNGRLSFHMQLERYQVKKDWRTRVLCERWYRDNGELWVEKRYRDGMLQEELRYD